MKALSVRQPWAWLIVHGIKNIENRTWPTKFRGEVYIHAAKKFDQAALDYFIEIGDVYFYEMPLRPSDYDRGGIVGRARIVDCITNGNGSVWFEGPFGFVLEKATPVKYIPCAGKLGFFSFDVPVRRYRKNPAIHKPVLDLMPTSSYMVANKLGISLKAAHMRLRYLEQIGYIERQEQKDGRFLVFDKQQGVT